MWRRVSYVLVGLSLTACAAAVSPSGHSASRNTGRDVITASEIVASHVTDVYQAVVQLRPEFLRRRSARQVASYARGTVAVYLDDLRFGNVETLRYIPLGQVRLIRYLSPNDADLRWGGSHPTGAILVTTLKP
jgi:hypothetical protein